MDQCMQSLLLRADYFTLSKRFTEHSLLSFSESYLAGDLTGWGAKIVETQHSRNRAGVRAGVFGVPVALAL
jgi:hypothetical protein